MEATSRIARLLREARERRGLSCAEAAEGAGLPEPYVRLLEGEAAVPVGVADEMYLIPFFRRYATFLGLDAPQLLPEFLGQVQHLPAATMSPLGAAQRLSVTRLWKPAAAIAALAASALLFARYFPENPSFESTEWPSLDAQLAANRVEQVAAAPERRDEGEPAADPSPERAAVVSPEPQAARASPGPSPQALATAPSRPESPRAGHELRIAADEETWLSIGVDDQPKKSLLMSPGDSEVWVASDVFTLTVGNAGGVTLVLDGRELPRLGKSGEVVRGLRLPEPPAPGRAAR